MKKCLLCEKPMQDSVIHSVGNFCASCVKNRSMESRLRALKKWAKKKYVTTK